MAGITEDEAAGLAIELNEAIPAALKIAKLDRASQVLVVKHFLDGMIGTDETALIDKIPYMTPEMTEGVTDGIFDVLAEAIVNKWFTVPEPAPEE